MDKSPPYSFDDPRILFDEPCFKFDGGFDEVCLAGLGLNRRKRVGVVGGSALRKKTVEKEERNVYDIKMKTSLASVNSEAHGSFGYQKHWIREDTLDAVKSSFTGFKKLSENALPKASLVLVQESAKTVVSELKQSNVISSSITISSITVVKNQHDN